MRVHAVTGRNVAFPRRDTPFPLSRARDQVFRATPPCALREAAPRIPRSANRAIKGREDTMGLRALHGHSRRRARARAGNRRGNQKDNFRANDSRECHTCARREMLRSVIPRPLLNGASLWRAEMGILFVKRKTRDFRQLTRVAFFAERIGVCDDAVHAHRIIDSGYFGMLILRRDRDANKFGIFSWLTKCLNVILMYVYVCLYTQGGLFLIIHSISNKIVWREGSHRMVTLKSQIIATI